MELCIPLASPGIDKLRSDANVQPWTCDQLALASGQVRQSFFQVLFDAYCLLSMAVFILNYAFIFPEVWSICILME